MTNSAEFPDQFVYNDIGWNHEKQSNLLKYESVEPLLTIGAKRFQSGFN